jgi:hypothetical protein
MQEWTDKAKEKLENYLENARVNLEGSDADADEVIEDLRRHIEEEVLNAKIEIVTKENVEKIIAGLKIDEPEIKISQKESASPSKKSNNFRWTTKFSTSNFVLAIVFGVTLPVVTILVEAFSGMCANTFFDPIPSYYHLILISFVPFGNLFVILSIRN